MKYGQVIKKQSGEQIIPGGFAILTGKDTKGAFSLAEAVMPVPVPGPPLHVHTREDETFYVIEGELTVRIGEKTFLLGPGDTAFAPQGIPHKWSISTGCRFLTHFSPAGFEEFFRKSYTGDGNPLSQQKQMEIQKQFGIYFLWNPIEKKEISLEETLKLYGVTHL